MKQSHTKSGIITKVYDRKPVFIKKFSLTKHISTTAVAIPSRESTSRSKKPIVNATLRSFLLPSHYIIIIIIIKQSCICSRPFSSHV